MIKDILKLADSRRLRLNVDQADSVGKTLFMIAAAYGHMAMVQYLTSREQGFNFNVHASGVKGNTALHLAASWNHLDMVERLRDEASPTMDKVNNDDETPLNQAVCYDAIEVIECLRRRGAKMNSRSAE
ncbi:hypothetical protein QQX98_000307 [Neonectria punicea]|uniref:ANK_REP_REGION domain-containing protein n=1 Tax=Neonectria punicea TaxID=979145 RepID=A0ABR1HV65_9HYPO